MGKAHNHTRVFLKTKSCEFFSACSFFISEESKKKAKWTPEEDQELEDLYKKHKNSGGENTPTTFLICWLKIFQIFLNNLHISVSVPDIVETLIPLLSSSRTRREVVSQMVVLGLVDSVKDLKKER